MGKIDVKTKAFWKDNVHFADLFNAVIYHGKKVIDPEKLIEVDSDVSEIVKSQKKYLGVMTNARDVVKKYACGTEYVLLGLENQTKVDYSMPVRAMLYDALGYWRECRILSDKKRKAEKEDKEDNIFFIGKEDKLHPIITLILYYGEDPWSGPKSLRELMLPVEEAYCGMMADYPLNIIEICNSDELHFLDEDVELLFSLVRKFYRKTIDHTFQSVKKNIAELVGIIVGSEKLAQLASRSKKEEIDMCRALDEMIHDGVRKGKIEGKIEAYLDMGLSMEVIAEKLQLSIMEVQIKAREISASVG